MKGGIIRYNAKELAWIKSHCTDVRKDMHKRFCVKFNRDVELVNLNALCKRKGWLTGRHGRFHKGNTSWNKGKKMPYNANSAKTQFKKGQTPHNTKYLGYEHITKDGFVEISVAETNLHTGYERRFVHKHRYLWEKKHGPIPKGKVLKCLDGNKANTELSNWKLISRGMLGELNRWKKYDSAPSELKPAIMAAVEIKDKVRELRDR
jgi:hypothetical protein